MNQTLYKPTFPWARTREGESFFVPCLALYDTATAGTHAAREHYGRNVRTSVQYGVFIGYLGVLFTRRKLPSEQKPS